MSTGMMSVIAYEAAKELQADGISCSMLNIHTIKPFDSEAVRKEWSDFIVQTGTKPAKVDDPPAGGDDPAKKEPHSIAEAVRQRMAAGAAHDE